MGTQAFASVEEYLGSLDSVKAKTLRTIITFVLSEFPELKAKLAWNVPHIHWNGKYLAGLAAYKNHLTFAPWSASVMETFKPRLQGLVVFKNCFHIPVDWSMDEGLVKDFVRARLAELD
ncbi:iron chaperone [Pseudoduganella aquatica]|uniref:iron chaperone n=1 Tax=Pseudoduganella aquatica TaxID=2660641 RepID=UPI001E4BBDBE|nr:DUF1801 domain-containing protein [Pseudoduganella aquatica]